MIAEYTRLVGLRRSLASYVRSGTEPGQTKREMLEDDYKMKVLNTDPPSELRGNVMPVDSVHKRGFHQIVK